MKFYIVDCFAEEKYQGNQLLVVIPDQNISDEEQQNIAREINFSETAFILSGKQENGGYHVRIWTPHSEVPFAGHPTLGTAYIIHRLIENSSTDEVKLNLEVGQITVRVSPQGLTMQQKPPIFGNIINKNEIADIYGISSDEIRDDYPIQWVSTGLEAVMVPLKSRKSLSSLSIDQQKFNQYVKRHPECYCNHLFFVDMEDNTFAARCLMEDFVEDPATGSANGNLAGYFLQYNYFNSNNISYTVYQGEDMGRRSVLHIHAELNDNSWTIEVGGNCYIAANGRWESI